MKPKQILLVDDEESLRRVTQLELEDLGFSVSTVADGQEALKVLATTPFQVVITDLKMPGMSGMDLLRRVRNDYPETAVIMITAFGSIFRSSSKAVNPPIPGMETSISTAS